MNKQKQICTLLDVSECVRVCVWCSFATIQPKPQHLSANLCETAILSCIIQRFAFFSVFLVFHQHPFSAIGGGRMQPLCWWLRFFQRWQWWCWCSASAFHNKLVHFFGRFVSFSALYNTATLFLQKKNSVLLLLLLACENRKRANSVWFYSVDLRLLAENLMWICVVWRWRAVRFNAKIQSVYTTMYI